MNWIEKKNNLSFLTKCLWWNIGLCLCSFIHTLQISRHLRFSYFFNWKLISMVTFENVKVIERNMGWNDKIVALEKTTWFHFRDSAVVSEASRISCCGFVFSTFPDFEYKVFPSRRLVALPKLKRRVCSTIHS